MGYVGMQKIYIAKKQGAQWDEMEFWATDPIKNTWLTQVWEEKKITIQKVWTWYCVSCYIVAISEFNDPIQHDTLLMPTLAKKCHIIIIIIRKKLIKKNFKE